MRLVTKGVSKPFRFLNVCMERVILGQHRLQRYEYLRDFNRKDKESLRYERKYTMRPHRKLQKMLYICTQIIRYKKTKKMKAKALMMSVAVACCAVMIVSCARQTETAKSELTTVGNPFLPMWEHIPDGEPYVFSPYSLVWNGDFRENSVCISMGRMTI